MLKRVEVLINHEDCWTPHIPFTVYTINLEVYPHKNYLRSRILIDSTDKNILNLMKAHKSVIKIIKKDKFKGGTYVDFLNIYKGSIAGLLYDREVLILNNVIKDGMEKWSFIASSKDVREIINELRSLGKVVNFKVIDFNPIITPVLTEMEKKVLTIAYTYGYLDYPRRTSADQLSELLNISKVTFLYHLRNAQRKIIDYSLKHISS